MDRLRARITLQRWSSPLLLGCVGTIGWLDWLTGPRYSFVPFYLIPILLGAWLRGSTAAWLLSGCAGVALYAADSAWTGHALDLAALWNLLTRLCLLGGLGQLTARVRSDRTRLSLLLSQRTSAHVSTVEQLRHRDRLALVGQIASGIAHEVGTPLNIIAGRARLITEPDGTLAEARLHARSVLEQTERLAATIRQLLDFARRRGPDLGPADMQELCRRAIDLIRPLAEKRRARVELLPAPDPAVAVVDYNQIQQALTNLVLNAIQAMPNGGLVQVSVRARDPDGAVLITVADGGTGISDEVMPRIFEPFFTTQRAGEGTGLGLSVTEGIVRDHGGHIEVHSEVGVGSRFTITLPCAQRSAAEDSP